MIDKQRQNGVKTPTSLNTQENAHFGGFQKEGKKRKSAHIPVNQESLKFKKRKRI